MDRLQVRLPKPAVSFVQNLPFDQAQPCIGQVFDVGTTDGGVDIFPKSMLVLSQFHLEFAEILLMDGANQMEVDA